MQLQFPTNTITCLETLKAEVQTREQTQELRIPEEMPELGRVLGAWGQVLVRGKQWQGGSMELSCGVMAWAMYQPENGGDPQMVEAWLPMNVSWELPSRDADGTMAVNCLLKSVDARPVSARRLMLRATVSVLAEAYGPIRREISQPEGVPEDVYLLKNTYPLHLDREAGEKHFELDEELTLPASAGKLGKLLRFSLEPEIMEERVMAGKVVFRGVGLVHILYRTEEGRLCSYDFQVPFSQYADLEGLYEETARARVLPAVTALELDGDLEGRLHLKAGITGQYCVSDCTPVTVAEDVYSPCRQVSPEVGELALPVILEESSRSLQAEAQVDLEGGMAADVAFYPGQPQVQCRGGNWETELTGQFQVLYYDREDGLQGAGAKFQTAVTDPAHPDSRRQTVLMPAGVPQAVPGVETLLRGDMTLRCSTTALWEIPMITGLEIGERLPPDPNRPSVVLRRAGEDTLWQIAKATGSTVEAIREANHLQQDPAEGQMLLIPVL